MSSPLSKAGSFLGRFWFPLALIVLFLLALPSVILFVLHQMGYAREVNAWLQQNFDISYHLAMDQSDAKWTWILLLLPLLILILYFLKLKRKPLQVPSTFLWKKSIEDLHVNSLFQWLRRNVLLLLQLLIVLFLIYAVMGFRIYGSVAKGRYYIIMIDNSASMSANDLGVSRLEWAKREALKEIDAAKDDDSGMVIVFNAKASTLQSYTKDEAKLRRAVQSIEPTPKVTRIEEALNLADSLANPLVSTEDVSVRPPDALENQERQFVPVEGEPTEVYLYSDGRFPDMSESALAQLNSLQAGNTSPLGNLFLHFRSAGKPGVENVNNVAIVAFNVVRLPEKKGAQTDPNTMRLQVLVRVRNYRPQPVNDLKLYLDVFVNGKPHRVEQQRLSLDKRKVLTAKEEEKKTVQDQPGEETVIFKLPPLKITANIVMHAYLPQWTDDLALDNEAWLAIGRRRKAKILIVGQENPILRAFFDQPAVEKIATVDRMGPEQLGQEVYRRAALSGEYDLIVFDECTPPTRELMPQANTFFIGDVPPPWQKSAKPLKDMPLLLSGKDHELVQQIKKLGEEKQVGAHAIYPFDTVANLQQKYKDQYTNKPKEKDKKLLPQVNTLIETFGNVPVVFTLPRGAYTDLLLAFPLFGKDGSLLSTWPSQTSFPLFLRNVLYVLGNVRDEVQAETVRAGEQMILTPEAGVQTLTVLPPRGPKQTLKRGSRPQFVFNDTNQLGIYHVVRDDQAEQNFAVTLLDADESNLQPRDAVTIGQETIQSAGERRRPRDIWKWIVLGALGLLILEWYIYNRRVYV